MKHEAKQIKFKEKIDNEKIYENVTPQNNSHERIIYKLMEKYDLSHSEANHILKKIELKEKATKTTQQQKPTKTTQQQKPTKTTQQQKPTKTTQQQKPTKTTQQQKPTKTTQQQNVNEIMSNFVEDYDKQLSIEVNNVDLTFEVETDKIDTLKESFIRTIKRNKSKKIKIHALNNISFKLYKGEKIGIIGYNGAGKSTLLKVICGIYPTDKGYVKTYGNISPLLGLGAGFDNNYSGRKNIFLNGAVLGYDKEFLNEKIEEIIEFSELREYIDLPIKNYSSGMKAKLSFSIATAVEPDILIIDEILGVGDINFSRKSRDKMRYLMDGGTTVILVSHSIQQIRDICDKAIWIDNGKLREIGEVNKVCDHYIKDAEKATAEQTKNIEFR